ncbi:protein kinase domain-containing protein [Nocardia aurea]|uniref:protein kinase domain-containing protein n=1 Tax=Nocardia aurea TaxID=2144174 RepID=UPI0033AC4AAF
MDDMWFGHYRLERLLGSGGTGRVWSARDTRTDRDVALKVLTAEVGADPAYRQRFTREARLAAQLRGPHTVPIHGFGELDGRLYLDMALIEGVDGAELLRREGRLAPDAAVRIVTQAAVALDAAHRIGLVHRDVKPSNLMVTSTGFVYLIDFGTAVSAGQRPITATGQMVGTLGYVAPERFGGTADARSDQYSLACVLYELLTRRRPFGDGDAPQQVCAHLMSTPPMASDLVAAVPPELDAVIARAMAKEPGDRWSTAGEFAAAAHAAVTGRDLPTVEIGPVSVPGPAIATIGMPAADTARTPGPVIATVGRQAFPVPGPATIGASTVSTARLSGSAIATIGVPTAGTACAPGHAPATIAAPTAATTRMPGPAIATVGSQKDSTSPLPGPPGATIDMPAAGAARLPGPATSIGVIGVGAARTHPSGPSNRRARSAAAVLAALFAVIGGALWLGTPGAGEPHSATPTTRPDVTVGPPTAAPIAAPPIALTPAAGRPCDPAAQGTGFDRDGVALRCTDFGGTATWASSAPQTVQAGPAPDDDVDGPPGQGNGPGQGNSGHGNPGHGNGKDKPGKPKK